MGRRAFVAANWKMNPDSAATARALVQGVRSAAIVDTARVEVALFPPYVWLPAVADEVHDLPVGLGAQDCFWERSGAFTGEVSASMLAGWCSWVLVGHSERREHFGETDLDVARKAEAALASGLSALVCVGERSEQYDAGETGPVVARQVRAALSRLPSVKPPQAELAFAYEPVWAIGSGRTPTPEQVAAVLEEIRAEAATTLGAERTRGLRVLYGGSVVADNVASFTSLEACDGCLVGGASLDAAAFSALIDAVREVA